MMKWCIVIFILLTNAVFVHAQIIRGNITAKESDLPIAGATIEAVEKHRFATSDEYGFFSFRNIKEGTVHLKITAVGFLPDSLSIVAEADKSPVLHIALQENIAALNNVIVIDSINKDSELYSRMLEKKSVSLVGIISRQSMEQSADITMADAIQRAGSVSLSADQAGVLTKAIIRGMDAKYSYTSVNGIALPSPDDKSRYVALNLFPASMIDRLEIYKTLTPEMPGDAIGGLMNIVTHQASAAQQFSVKFATGYSQVFFDRSFLSFNSNVVQQKSPYEKYGANYYAAGSDFTKDNLLFKNIHPLPDIQADISWGKNFSHKNSACCWKPARKILKKVPAVFLSCKTANRN